MRRTKNIAKKETTIKKFISEKAREKFDDLLIS